MKTLAGVLYALVLPFLTADWTVENGFRWMPLAKPGGDGSPGFDRIDPASIGITFTNALSAERVTQFQNLMNGNGVAAADVDGDGWVDLFLCHRQSTSRLYRNLGDGRFVDVTEASGLAGLRLIASGAVFGDLDGDGAQDLLVSSFGGPHACFRNDGKGHFRDVTAEAGITGKSGASSMALSDVDGDGDLDLYWCNFALEALFRDGSVVTTRVVDGKTVVTGRYAKRIQVVDGNLIELGDPDVLYLNDGTGKFTPAPWETHFADADGQPVSAPLDLGLAVQIRDIDGNGTPDIYVCNDFHTPDRVWLGDGKGHFRAPSPWALRNMTFASMGVDFADLDRDGRLDFVTLDMLHRDLRWNLRTSRFDIENPRVPGIFPHRENVPRNCLYWNRGDGSWAEIGIFAGIAATDWSWTPLFLDVDLDGWEDLLVSNGYQYDVNDLDSSARIKASEKFPTKPSRNLYLGYPPLTPPKFAFQNRRDRTFEEVGTKWGFNATNIAHGLISADLDRDGDLDLVANCQPGPPLVYLNRTHAPRVAVRLRGRKGNPDGLGARILLRGGPVEQQQEMVAGGQYLSHAETVRTFAAGSGPMSLEVRWRSGRVSRVEGVLSGRLYEVEEAGATEAAPVVSAPPGRGWFEDVSPKLDLRHHEEPWDDFGFQPLVPRRYSQEGPPIMVSDIDGDGNLDVVMGSGRGGRLEIRTGNGKGEFRSKDVSGPELPDDLLGLVHLPGAGGGVIAGAVANLESGAVDGPSVLLWKVEAGGLTPMTPLPSVGSSPGCLAAGDFDGDGDVDLFVGGRLIPGRWPEPAASGVFLAEGGTFKAEPLPGDLLHRLGLVTAAAVVDLDGDRVAEVVVAKEFGALQALKRTPAGWKDVTAEVGLESGVGLWNSLVAIDVDGDGALDLVAGNEGRNSQRTQWGDPAVVWNSSDRTAPVLLVESAMVGGEAIPVRNREFLSTLFGDLPVRFPNHTAYSQSNSRAVLGGDGAKLLVADEVRSCVFLRRQGKFVKSPLPQEAQWAPVSGIAAGDFNGDGKPDLFLAQNRFALRKEDTAADAGAGCVLVGDGRGGFRSSEAIERGNWRIHGEQRGVAAGDFNKDGRIDLVVSQNGAQTRLLMGLAP